VTGGVPVMGDRSDIHSVSHPHRLYMNRSEVLPVAILSERSSKIRHFLTRACCTAPKPSAVLPNRQPRDKPLRPYSPHLFPEC
jgi:hypothetical protein